MEMTFTLVDLMTKTTHSQIFPPTIHGRCKNSEGCKHCSNLPCVIGTFSADRLLMCRMYILIKRPYKILLRLSGEAVKESQTVVVVTFGSAVYLTPPPDSCFTVVIQVCSLLSPSFNPSPLTPALHCSHSNTPASHHKLFLRTFCCHSWVAVGEAPIDCYLLSQNFAAFLCYLSFAIIDNKGGFRTHSQFPCPLGREGWLDPLPPPNCWHSKMQHASELMLMCAEFGTKTTSWMTCLSTAIIWLLY